MFTYSKMELLVKAIITLGILVVAIPANILMSSNPAPQVGGGDQDDDGFSDFSDDD